jgi:hypothetical protein
MPITVHGRVAVATRTRSRRYLESEDDGCLNASLSRANGGGSALKNQRG